MNLDDNRWRLIENDQTSMGNRGKPIEYLGKNDNIDETLPEDQ